MSRVEQWRVTLVVDLDLSAENEREARRKALWLQTQAQKAGTALHRRGFLDHYRLEVRPVQRAGVVTDNGAGAAGAAEEVSDGQVSQEAG